MIDDYNRQAIWEAYDKKCFYCREFLAYKNIHIDHVIPQKSFKKNGGEIISKYNLKGSFDFNSIENLVSACQNCNVSRKSHIELESAIPIWLNQISGKISYIGHRANEIMRSLYIDLPNELQDFLVSSPEFMLTSMPLNRIRKIDIGMYKLLPFNDMYYSLELTHPEKNDIKVDIRNLLHYEEMSNLEYYPLTTQDISFASKLDACLYLFKMLENAKHIPYTFRLKDYYHKLPIEILFSETIDEDDSECNQLRLLSEHIDAGGIYCKIYSDTTVEICEKKMPGSGRQISYKIKEILQADFSGNGNIEVILFIHYQSRGTLNFSYSRHCAFVNDEWKICN